VVGFVVAAHQIGARVYGLLGSALLAAPGKRIARARDLIGKRIAIDTQNTIAHIGLLKWLKSNGVSAGDVHQKRNDAASGAILARYAPIDKSVIPQMTRTRFAARLRPALAQPWIDVYAEFGIIPASFPAIELVR